MRELKALCAIAVLLILINAAPALSATVYVRPTGNNANDGLSWNSPKLTVQAGIDAAFALGGGEVWVAAGAYNKRVTMQPGVALYGGFAGVETAIAERDWKRNVTVLDGKEQGSVVTISTGLGPGVVLDGFTIKNGRAVNGGGIECQNSSATISNNVISGNTASGAGGGIHCDGDLYSVVIVRNEIKSNTAASGGGIACVGGESSEISWNVVSSNKATAGSGGGILSSAHGLDIYNNIIKYNSASASGGGVQCGLYAEITNSLITDNTAASGGGVSCDGYLELINSTITGNSATAGNGGGLLCAAGSQVSISNTILAFNSSGIWCDAGVTLTWGRNCVYGNGTLDYFGIEPGPDNISVDPLFVDPAAGNYHLQAASPCADVGDGDVQCGILDVDNQPRVYGTAVDLGADEWNPSAPAPVTAPVNLSVSPDTGTLLIGVKKRITTYYTDADGYADITYCYLLLNTSLSEVNGVVLKLDVRNNLVYIRDDSGANWLGPRTPATPWNLYNSYFVLYCSGMSVTGSLDKLTVKWQIVLKPITAGLPYQAWMRCEDSSGLVDGWDKMGDLLVENKLVHEPVSVSLTPNSGQFPVETKTTFTTVHSDGDGYANLYGGHLLLTPDGTLVNAAYFKYDFNSGKMYVKDDQAINWLGGYSAGSSNIIENSFVRLYCAESSRVSAGETVTVNWQVSFKTAKVGKTCSAYLLTWDDGGLFDDWRKFGSISLVSGSTPANNTPANVSLTPNSGAIQSAQKTILTSVYSDADGYANLANCYLLLNDRLSEAYAADFRYDSNTNKLYVRNNSGSSWLGGYAPGAANVIENTFCRLYCADTTTSGSDASRTVNWAIELKPILAGAAATAWMQITDDLGAKDSWETMGGYTIN
ncbi:MAG: DUF1565 domain-containing protein [Armatimonadota bacterium]|nr:DUF1565 domain-containing protein [Armatimonadota bacterium]